MEGDRPPLKHRDINPAYVQRDEYGFNAENRPKIVVDPSEVPAHLVPLIPYVERWGIPCDVTRGDYFDKQPEEDIAEFYYAVEPHAPATNEWLDSLPEDVAEWPAAGVQFMYMLKAHCEAYQPTHEEIAERDARVAEAQRWRRRKLDIDEAMAAFKAKSYGRVVELLSPYDESLSDTEAAKLRFSQRKQTEGESGSSRD